MFDEVAEKMYQLVVQKRQYKNYINCLKLYNVPPCAPLFTTSQLNQVMPLSQTASQVAQPVSTETAAVMTPAATGDPAQAVNPEAEKPSFYDIRLYNDLMDSISPEYISTDLIVHCLVEQVRLNKLKKLMYTLQLITGSC